MSEKVTYSPDQVNLLLELIVLSYPMNTDTLIYDFLRTHREQMQNELHEGIKAIYTEEAAVGSLVWIHFIANLPGVKKPEKFDEVIRKVNK